MRYKTVDKPKGKHIKNIACELCQEAGKDKKGNNLSVYQLPSGELDGFCWSCQTYFSNIDSDSDNSTIPVSDRQDEIGAQETLTMTNIVNAPFKPLGDRRLKIETVSRYGVKQIEDLRFYPRFQKDQLTGYKCRKLPKCFDPKEGARPVGDISTDCFFGQQLFDKGNGVLVITEGEEDAMSVYQVTQEHSPKHVGYASVSVPNGLASLKKTVLDNYTFLTRFEKVVFALDQEKDVLVKVREVCKLLPPRKAFIAKFELKDASDMLRADKGYELYKAIWNAEEYKPDGLVLSSETWDSWSNRSKYDSVPLPEEWGLCSILKGIRKGGLYTIGAGTGVGKTTMLKILQLHLWRSTNDNVGVIALEEPLCDSIGMLMGLYLNKRIHVEESVVSEQEQKETWQKLFGDNRFVFETGFGSLTSEDLFDKIRYMCRVQNCKYIFIDHLTLLTDMFGDGHGSKIEQTAKLVAQIKNLTQELDCAIIQVSHVRKRDEASKSFEEGAVPSLDSLYGAAAIKQYSDAVIVIARDQREEVSTTTYHVIKNRLTGRLGVGNPLVYDFNTGWLIRHKEAL